MIMGLKVNSKSRFVKPYAEYKNGWIEDVVAGLEKKGFSKGGCRCGVFGCRMITMNKPDERLEIIYDASNEIVIDIFLSRPDAQH